MKLHGCLKDKNSCSHGALSIDRFLLAVFAPHFFVTSVRRVFLIVKKGFLITEKEPLWIS